GQVRAWQERREHRAHRLIRVRQPSGRHGRRDADRPCGRLRRGDEAACARISDGTAEQDERPDGRHGDVHGGEDGKPGGQVRSDAAQRDARQGHRPPPAPRHDWVRWTTPTAWPPTPTVCDASVARVTSPKLATTSLTGRPRGTVTGSALRFATTENEPRRMTSHPSVASRSTVTAARWWSDSSGSVRRSSMRRRYHWSIR